MKIPKYTKPREMKAFDTLKELAAYWGMSARTVENWSRSEMLEPDGETGLWRSEDIALILEEKESAAGIKPEQSEALQRWQLARAEKAEFELERMKDKYIERSDFERYTRELCQVFKSAMLGMGRALAPQLEGLSQLEIARKLEDHCKGILNQIVATNEAHKG